MASLARFGRVLTRPILKNSLVSATQSRGAAVTTWNKDWKPAPYPRTPEDRAAAAKRYGLRPEDYEPYPDDGFGYGDYPMLPRLSADARDPYDNWDVSSTRRNYGEPVHVDADIMREDCWNPNIPRYTTFPQMYLWFASVVGGYLFLYWLSKDYPYRRNAMPAHKPEEGKVHQTFEALD